VNTGAVMKTVILQNDISAETVKLEGIVQVCIFSCSYENKVLSYAVHDQEWSWHLANVPLERKVSTIKHFIISSLFCFVRSLLMKVFIFHKDAWVYLVTIEKGIMTTALQMPFSEEVS